MMQHSIWFLLGSILHLLAFLTITLHCLQRRRNASSTILWIAIAWAFPVLGPLLYLSFGVDRVADRGFKKFLTNEMLLKARQKNNKTASLAFWHDFKAAPPGNEFQRELNRTFDALIPDHPPLAGNQITPLVGGDETYPKMLAAIRDAKIHIHLQSFIISNDQISRDFLEALAAKADEGITIRLLYDRFGSTKAHLSGLLRSYRKHPNFHISGWTQANPLKRQFQINLRNHRKALIVDGTQAFFGGVNIHDENCSSHKKGPIRDYHFQVEGPLVQEFQYAFLRDWYFITKEDPETLLSETCFPKMESDGAITARLINSGPSTEKDVAVEAFFNSIVLAKHQILAVTPYFAPPEDILRAMRSAALRGVDVRLIVPQKNNHLVAGFSSQGNYEDLLLAGVRIFERHPPFMHAKALIIDGEFSLIGSANIDNRSLHLNYETCAAVYSTELADAMKNIIHEDMNCSDEIQLHSWNQRPGYCRLLENLASLLDPIL